MENEIARGKGQGEPSANVASLLEKWRDQVFKSMLKVKATELVMQDESRASKQTISRLEKDLEKSKTEMSLLTKKIGVMQGEMSLKNEGFARVEVALN